MYPPDVEEEPSSSDDSEPHAPRNPDASAGAEASSTDLVGGRENPTEEGPPHAEVGTHDSPAVGTPEEPQAADNDQHVVLYGAIAVDDDPQTPWKPSWLAQTLS